MFFLNDLPPSLKGHRISLSWYTEWTVNKSDTCLLGHIKGYLNLNPLPSDLSNFLPPTFRLRLCNSTSADQLFLSSH